MKFLKFFLETLIFSSIFSIFLTKTKSGKLINKTNNPINKKQQIQPGQLPQQSHPINGKCCENIQQIFDFIDKDIQTINTQDSEIERKLFKDEEEVKKTVENLARRLQEITRSTQSLANNSQPLTFIEKKTHSRKNLKSSKKI